MTKNIKEKIIILSGSKKKKSIKVALANHLVKYDELLSSLRGKSITTVKRKRSLFKLLNAAKEERADFVVLPENSVPFGWLDILNSYVKKNRIGIVCGLEHLNLGKTVYNYQAVILPIGFSGIKDAFLSLRLKNNYSPREEFLIEDYGYNLPVTKEAIYEIYKWCGVSFSTYNCYELADIIHRSLFKSRVDFIVATEYNKDTEYFSNVAESLVRDIHCFFIQVNSSGFGDSRVTQPSKSYKKDLVRLKGGENDTILTATLKIDDLREFQRKGYGLQKEDDSFKPTPPGFDKTKIDQR